MNEADKTFKATLCVIHATLGIPRVLFAIRTDKNMPANFGNGTIDVFLVHDLRVMYYIFIARKSLNLRNSFLNTMPHAMKTSLLEATINYDTSGLSEHQCVCQARLLAILLSSSYSFIVSTVSDDSRIVNELSAEARYLLTLTWTSFLLIRMFFIQ